MNAIRKINDFLTDVLAGIFLLFLCPFGLLLTGIATVDAIVAITLGACFCWIIAYIIAHFNVIILRFKYPNLERPFKTPVYPLPQILGIVGLVYVLLNIFPDPAVKGKIYAYAFSFLVVAGIYAVIWVKVRMKQSLFTPVPYKDALEE